MCWTADKNATVVGFNLLLHNCLRFIHIFPSIVLCVGQWVVSVGVLAELSETET